ncbi:MAG: LL-diaminopimelate aminotransferase [Omnitrophica bacterium RIFCSPHIGHO2_02_FULL_46_11]|nr:MAG: LL-diaminopimelate aminotransferase [Omnitrophica bacterium RIFCSPHIGHO2_02_FULL_46_11]OGW87695.1 MAG: LL-diaminopimelate aminotransferase [Omnitrophica bacterium RIFCSPLOWO2_01_FULL_45_10b]
MKKPIEPPDRLKKLPPYLFAEIDRIKRELIAQGKDVIDLGVGDPDLPTPSFIIEALSEAAKNPANHRYALDQGMPELRRAIAAWYEKRFHVRLDPDKEILPLIGSKEGIGHVPLALVNPGDVVLVPDPGYPVYKSAAWFAGGEPYLLPLLEENNYLVDFDSIDKEILARAKMMFLNYPNNPTSACASKEFFAKAIKMANEHGFFICHDAAYTEIAFDNFEPLSFLQVDGAKEIGIEFHSLSKTFNMTGWRIGFACGNAQILQLLAKVKSNLDSGIFQAIQWAGIKALSQGIEEAKKNSKIYERRRDLLVNGLNSMGWKIPKPKATFYVWAPVPSGSTSQEFASRLLKEANLVVTPGNGFGPNGEGYFRLSLTIKEERITEALKRIKQLHGR